MSETFPTHPTNQAEQLATETKEELLQKGWLTREDISLFWDGRGIASATPVQDSIKELMGSLTGETRRVLRGTKSITTYYSPTFQIQIGEQLKMRPTLQHRQTKIQNSIDELKQKYGDN